MSDLVNSTFTPTDQAEKTTPVQYVIKPLKTTQLTELLMDGCARDETGATLTYKGVMLCIKHGLQETTGFDWAKNPENIPATHLAEVATQIFNKALLAETERKNLLSQ
jgi:hypothetical protein